MIRYHRVKYNLNTIVTSPLFSLPGLRLLRRLTFRYAFGLRGVIVGNHVRFTGIEKPESAVKIGRRVVLQDGVTIDCSGGVEIADVVTISRGTTIYTHAHRIHDRSRPWRQQGETPCPITIETDTWVGAHSVILPSVNRIGEGAIIGAGSVVTKDVAPYTIVAGNPAGIVGRRE